MRQNFFSSTEFHAFVDNTWLNPQNPLHTHVYLPLERTKYTVPYAHPENPNTFLQLPIYGISGPKEHLPLILIGETEQGVEAYVFAKYKAQKIRDAAQLFYYPLALEESQKKYLQDLLNSRIQVRSGTTKNAAIEKAIDSATPMDGLGDDFWDVKTPVDRMAPAVHTKKHKSWKTPKDIVTYLDEYVIGQHEAKMSIAGCVHTYLLQREAGKRITKDDHIIVAGPSGSGKTFVISLVAKEAGIPVAITKATGKAGTGYVGGHLTDAYQQIRTQTNEYDPFGIVYIDEADKLAHSTIGGGAGWGQTLQDEIIGYADSEEIHFDSHSGLEPLNTRNILHVLSGAFHGIGGPDLWEIARNRTYKKQRAGFSIEYHNIPLADSLFKITTDDFIAYGMKTELLRRFGTQAIFTALTSDEKKEILLSAKDSVLEQYQSILEMRGCRMTFEPSAIDAIVKNSPEATGAGGVSQTCKKIFHKILYDLESYAPKDHLHLSGEIVKKILDL